MPNLLNNRTAGLSLIELLTVIGIIMLLVAISLPVVQSVRNSVRGTQAVNQVQGLYAACEVYAMEDRRRLPPPVEADLSLRTNLGGSGPARTLDLLRERGCEWRVADLGPESATGRVLLDAWRRPVRYQSDIDMDATADKPAALADWNAKEVEPYAYVWSLGRPSGAGDAADADTTHAEHWIYKKNSK